ncbi:hypothetical protein [Streptomyces sp. TRM64462]|uniref:hypothetical protein n=1 Tax=Streptomyces sp. TRM64462 TaxID=2741726 RepID=UPI001586F228|nr:hypothetical protein [Streptomyces sp. TRM64462]
MRASFIRRSAVAASAVSLALLVTACGGDKEGGKEGGKDAGAGDKAKNASAAKALTAAELEKAALAQGDVPGYKVEKAGPADLVDAGAVTVDKAECKPLADAWYTAKPGSPAAAVQRKVVQEPASTDPGGAASQDPAKDKKLGDMTEEELDKALKDMENSVKDAFSVNVVIDGLSSYDGKGAEEALASLRTAATACAGGFTATVKGEPTKVLRVEEEKVSGGQEAAGWALITDADGDELPLKLVLVRHGQTLASFGVVNLGAAMSGAKDLPLPTAVIDAQVGKLAKLG